MKISKGGGGEGNGDKRILEEMDERMNEVRDETFGWEFVEIYSVLGV